MANLNDIVSINITRATTSITTASFNSAMIVSEFAADKTDETFDRERMYASLTEMIEDGWTTADREYKKAAKTFSQNPRISYIRIGRKKLPSETSETWTQALNAIQNATTDWYAFTINPTQKAKVVFSADLITDNSVTAVINGVTCDPVVFATTHLAMMQAIKAEIEAHAGLTDTVVTIDPTDTDNRTLIIEKEGGSITSASLPVLLGATQASTTVTYDIEDDIKEVAAWTETMEKVFFFTTDDANVITSSTTDLVSDLKALGYDRTVACYHPDLLTDTDNEQHFAEGFIGKVLVDDPGTSTWAYKSMTGIVSYYLTSAQRTYALNKYCNIYTACAGVDITEEGKVISGEWIDVITGCDWIKARMAEDIFSALVNIKKIPYTDAGVQIIVGIVKAVLDEAVTAGILSSYTVSFPKVANIDSDDKLDRLLPDITFTGVLAGAVHKVEVDGTVSV